MCVDRNDGLCHSSKAETCAEQTASCIPLALFLLVATMVVMCQSTCRMLKLLFCDLTDRDSACNTSAHLIAAHHGDGARKQETPVPVHR